MKKGITKESCWSRVHTKLAELVGKPSIGADGNKSFLENRWKSDEQRDSFLAWFTSELRREKDMYEAYTGERNNTIKNCQQFAIQWNWNRGPKEAN